LDALTIEALLRSGDRAGALAHLVGALRLNTGLCTFAYVDRSDSGEGLTTTDYRRDPVTGNFVPADPSTVEIYTPAYTTLPVLVSTVMHEYQHVLQHQRERAPEELAERADEETTTFEVEAYLWELEHAADTGLIEDPPQIQELKDRLTDHYDELGQINPARQAVYTARYRAAMLVGGGGVSIQRATPSGTVIPSRGPLAGQRVTYGDPRDKHTKVAQYTLSELLEAIRNPPRSGALAKFAQAMRNRDVRYGSQLSREATDDYETLVRGALENGSYRAGKFFHTASYQIGVDASSGGKPTRNYRLDGAPNGAHMIPLPP
jgi:hypothetical protein